MKQREIKFRVWDNVDYMSTPFTPHDLQMRKVMFTEDCVLMQFTGILDKNGKEIYEGDVIKYFEMDVWCKAKIIWNEHCGAWQYQYEGVMGGNHSDFLYKLLTNTRFPKQVEVIGNVFQNPELLTPSTTNETT